MQPAPLPTPEDIRAACFEIQRTWDRRIELLRRGLVSEPEWSIPSFHTEMTREGLAVVPEDCARLAPDDQPEV